MFRLIFFIAFSVVSISCRAVPYVLEKEFKNAMDRNYSEKEFLRFYHVIDSLEASTEFAEFKSYQMYTSNISKMLNSFNVYQKGIAYRLVAALKDVEFNALLQERLPSETNKFLQTLNAYAVMRLAPKQTTIAFDYLVDNEDFATSSLIPVYLEMDALSIVKTAYARLNDKRPKGKVFALQTLARFDPSPSVDSIIIDALERWDVSIKGYAIVALGVHRKGHFKDILAPYYKELQLRDVILETLEDSQTGADVLYAEELKRNRR